MTYKTKIKKDVEDFADFLNISVQQKKANKALVVAKELEKTRKEQGYKYRKLDENTRILTLKTGEELIEAKNILLVHNITTNL